MIPSYPNKIFEDLKTYFDNNNFTVPFQLINDVIDKKRLKKQLENGEMPALIVLDARRFEYIKDTIIPMYSITDYEGNQTKYNYDYINTMPIKLLCSLAIYSIDITQISLFEELIHTAFKTPHKLSIKHPQLSDTNINFSLSTQLKFEREKCEVDLDYRPFYTSSIIIVGENCVSCTEKYTAAVLALDDSIKPFIIKRLAALEEIKKTLIEQNKNGDNSNKINSIDIAWKQLDNIADSTQGITTYHNLYDFMTSNNCNNEKALNEIRKEQEKIALEEKQQKKNKEEKIRYAEKICNKKGDEILNRYTDIIVEDIKKNLKTDFSVSVYGGSTLCDYLKKVLLEEIHYPTIVVWDIANFSLDLKQYLTLDSNRTEITHKYSKEILPLIYGVNFTLLTSDKQQEEKLKTFIEQNYYKEKIIDIPDLTSSEEIFPLHISCHYKKTVVKNEFLSSKKCNYIQTLYEGKQYPCVYHLKPYSHDDLTDNQRLQFRIVQQAEFMLYCRNLGFQALKQFDKDYINLSQKQNSVVKSLLNTVFTSAEYKRLKEAFNYGKPIERNLFESVLKNIVSFYPCLYDKMIQGYSIEQIRTEINDYKIYFESKHNYLCDLLNIPQSYSNDLHGGPRHFKALQFYAQQMIANPACTIDIAIKNYIQQCDKEKTELAARNRAYLEERTQEQGYNSSSGGFLSNMLSTAGGVAMGNKISSTGQRNNNKKDLFGTSACQRCHSNTREIKKYTCTGCPAESRCTKQYN